MMVCCKGCVERLVHRLTTHKGRNLKKPVECRKSAKSAASSVLHVGFSMHLLCQGKLSLQ